jgi:TorA maturation chaperone TorD
MTETAAASQAHIEDVDYARAREYSLLAALLTHAPSAQLLVSLAELTGDETPLGLAHTALALVAARTNEQQVAREYFNLFVGVGRGELLPYASFYQTGFLHGRPLAYLRQTLAQIGVERVEGESEPEDHAAILFEIMGGLAGGGIAAPTGTDREFFTRHLAPWIGRFCADLERNESGDFYARVGALGRVFMAIETEAFTL